jgi:hypothetical protein
VNNRLVSLSGNQPESLGDGGISAVVTIVSTIISVAVSAATTIVSGVQSKRAREAADAQRKIAMQVQANTEIAAMDTALKQRNANIESGYQQLLKKAVDTSTMKKYAPVAIVGGSLLVGAIAMKRKD